MVAKKRANWRLILIPAFCAAGILMVVFWDAILIRIAPKVVLTSALNKVFIQLQERFQDDPLWILIRSLDSEGKYTAKVKLDTANDVLGPISYDMTIQTDGCSHRLYAEGTAATSEQNLDLSLYMDADFMAISSQDLVKGNYYGITYDSFSKDLRSIPLLNLVVSDNLLSQWDESVQRIQAQMSRDYSLLQIPEISQEDVQNLMIGVLALPCEIENCSISLPDDGFSNCHKLDYSISGDQIRKIFSEFTDMQYDFDETATVSFYLHQKSVVKIAFTCVSKERTLTHSLTLGENPGEEMLYLSVFQNENGQQSESVITIMTRHNESRYDETLNFYRTAEESSVRETIEYEWDLTSGEMVLKCGNPSNSSVLKLTETDSGFQLMTDDLAKVLQVLTKSAQESQKISCTMTISKGSAFSTPEYRNLNQWSMEDFLILLGGIGSLLGINIK